MLIFHFFLYCCYFCILLLIINCTIFLAKCVVDCLLYFLFLNVATYSHFVYLVNLCSILFSYVYSVYFACIPSVSCVSVCCIGSNFPVILIVLWLLIVKKKSMSCCTLFYGIVTKCCKISLPCLREFTAQSCG